MKKINKEQIVKVVLYDEMIFSKIFYKPSRITRILKNIKEEKFIYYSNSYTREELQNKIIDGYRLMIKEDNSVWISPGVLIYYSSGDTEHIFFNTFKEAKEFYERTTNKESFIKLPNNINRRYTR